MTSDLQATVHARPIMAVVMLSAISALDGFSVLSVTFAAPGFSRAFGLDATALGWVLAIGLIGMGLGSLLLAPFADLFGRRRLVLLNLVLIMVGMLASATANGQAALIAARLLTGLGTGAMIAVLAPLAAEYASPARRELAVGLMSIGYPVGGMLGGAVSALLLHGPGWRAVFLLGSASALLLIPLVALCVPESIAYLMDRRPPDALDRINALLRRQGRPLLGALPGYIVAPAPAPLKELLHGRMLWHTLQITAINFLFVTSAYYFLNWMPAMVAHAGHSAATAATVSVIANVSGVVGGILLGWLAPRLGLRRVGSTALIGAGCGTAWFGSAAVGLEQMMLSAAVTGFFVYGGFVGIFSIIARAFAPRFRATGSGWVIGMGRGGSALATVLAGSLFAAGISSQTVSLWMGSGAIVAGTLLATVRLREAGR